MTRRVERALSDQEMEQIRAKIDAAPDMAETLLAAIVTTYDLLLAPFDEKFADFTAENRLDPMQYAIPNDQWIQICEWLQARVKQVAPGGLFTLPNVALDWMNVGPSTFRLVEPLRSVRIDG